MIMLDTLTHIDHPWLSLEVQQVVLRKVGMDEMAYLVHLSHDDEHPSVAVKVVLLTESDVFESWSRHSTLTDKFHEDYVVLLHEGFRSFDPSAGDTS